MSIIVKSLSTSTQKFQKEISSISNIEAQMGDIVTSLSKLEFHGNLPSQPEKNPNVNVVNLRSGKQIRESSSKKKSMEDDEEIEINPN